MIYRQLPINIGMNITYTGWSLPYNKHNDVCQINARDRTIIRLYIYTHTNCKPLMQGRKSMFKHGGDNIGEKCTSRLRDDFRSAKLLAFLGGFGGMPAQEKLFKCGNLVCIWINFVFKKI